MDAAEDEVLAYLTVPQAHWREVWSTNPLERLNKEVKRRSQVVGIFPSLRLQRHRFPHTSLTS